MHEVQKTLDHISKFEIIDQKHEMDGDSLWNLLDSTAKNGPHGSKDRFLRLEWPKSLKELEKRTFKDPIC
jgi:hypothetical protein